MTKLGVLAIYTGSLLCALTFCDSARSQQNSCPPVELPVNVILPDGKLVRGLQRDHLVALAKKDRLKIESVNQDLGPRRILFVLDTGRDLSRDGRKAEAAAAANIVEKAAEDTSFALITTRGATTEVHFGEPRENLVAAIRQILEPAGKLASAERGGLDALSEGIKWFGTPQPGDAIVAMVLEIENNNHTKYSTVADALADRHIRLFSFLLGPLMAGTSFFSMGGAPGRPAMNGVMVANEENLDALTWNSGGYLVVENTKNELREYKLTDEHLEALRRESWQMYGAVAEFYRVLLIPPANSGNHEKWSLELSESIRKRVPQAKVLFPRELPACR